MSTTFSQRDHPVSGQDIDSIEGLVGLRFPKSVRELYLLTNGGVPTPYVFENDNLDTVVAEFLPLKSPVRGSAVIAYDKLIKSERLAPRSFFPFAVDGGGDYFFIDCDTAEATVYFLRSDTTHGPRLLNLKLNFSQFWAELKSE